MRFSDIVGLGETKSKLVASVKNNHVAHAQLFLGKPGSANLSMALAFATYINCENPNQDDACGICSSCSKALKYIHPDIHFVFPVSPIEKKEGISLSFLPEWRKFLLSNPYGNEEDWSNFFGGENKQLNISKEESRQIIKNLSLKSFEGSYKVMIIWLAEYFHPSAANGILKILEEPPENTVFILVCNDHEKLLSTIISRTQVFNIRPFSNEEITAFIQQKTDDDIYKIRQIAAVASGNLNLALKLLTEIEDDTHTVFRDWMRVCFSKKYDVLSKWTDQFAAMNKVAQKSLIQYGINMLREALIAQYHMDDLQKVANEEENDFVKNFGIKALKSGSKIEKVYQELNSFLYHLERNINPKIAFLDTSLKINSIIRS